MKPRSGLKHTVLVVDDEPCTRHLMKLLLENLGFLVQEANFGLEAIQKAKESMPDIMIFDLKQANRQGFAIYKPNEDKTAVTPIALLNAHTHWSVFTKLLSENATKYIPKPISSIELGSVFRDLVGRNDTAVSISA